LTSPSLHVSASDHLSILHEDTQVIVDLTFTKLKLIFGVDDSLSISADASATLTNEVTGESYRLLNKNPKNEMSENKNKAKTTILPVALQIVRAPLRQHRDAVQHDDGQQRVQGSQNRFVSHQSRRSSRVPLQDQRPVLFSFSKSLPEKLQSLDQDYPHRRDRLRSPSSYGHRILGSNRKYFASLGPDSLAPLSKLNYKFNYL